MIYVALAVDDRRFAVLADSVIGVVPSVPLRPIDATPPWVAGVFTHGDHIVPVVDLCQLHAQHPCRRAFSTRILLVHYPAASGEDRTLGLQAERVTEAVSIAKERWRPSGIATPEAPWLGPLAEMPDGTFLQLVTPTDLLPASVRQRLFP
jgi:chemotaxis-related protein WspB